MKKQFKLSVPKPCHEDWSKMTPKEKGRFCQSCSKTVVDFTQHSKEGIQQYLRENLGQQVCGRLRREQLDMITLEIPTATFHQSLSFQKLFLLALLFVMGSTLFSCQHSNGTKQKIKNVIVTDTIEEVHETGHFEIDRAFHLDSIVEIEEPEEIIEDISNTLQSQDSVVEIVELTGEVVEVVGDIEPYEEETDVVLGYIIEEPPKFPEADSLSRSQAREDFDRRMRLLFEEHFNYPEDNLGLKKGPHRIFIHFTVDTKGYLTDIQIKAPHPVLTKEIERVLKKLPVLIPGRQRGKVVKTRYALPIRYNVHD